jgi:hypothetical protein
MVKINYYNGTKKAVRRRAQELLAVNFQRDCGDAVCVAGA